MRLIDYIGSRALLPRELLEAHPAPRVRAFLFGDAYSAETTWAGRAVSIPFDDLETALGVMTAEFGVHDDFVPWIQIADTRKAKDPIFGITIGNAGGVLTTPKPDARVDAFVLAMAPPSFGPAAQRVLGVTLSPRNTFFEAPPIEAYAEQVRQAVIYYSIAGTWDNMDGKSNL